MVAFVSNTVDLESRVELKAITLNTIIESQGALDTTVISENTGMAVLRISRYLYTVNAYKEKWDLPSH